MVDTVPEQGQINLHEACARGDLDSVKRLINEGASIHRVCLTTPLYHALRGNPTSPWHMGGKLKLEVARYLIEHGADVNLARRIDGTSSLLINFCETGPIEVVEFLLDHGAEANVAALNYTCQGRCRSVELCQLLLDHGAPVDPPVQPPSHTPLWYTCISHNVDSVKLAAFLLDRGADINRMKSTASGHPASGYLGAACAASHVAMAQLLLDRGADADHVFHGKTPLQYARLRARGEYLRTIQDAQPEAQIHPQYRKDWPALIALLEAAPPARVRLRTHWRHRILFHVVGRRTANPGSKRHELGLYRVSTIASFLM